MKTKIAKKSSAQGTALLVALFLCLILSVSVAGYMKNAQQQHFMSTRSQTWNLSMTVTESGIEEALEHLNSNSGGNLAVDGWQAVGATSYTVSRDLNDSGTSRYKVTINMATPNFPVISAQSFVNTIGLALTPQVTPTFAVGGVNVVPVQPATISRAVKVIAGRNSLWQKPMVARHKIDFNGNNVMTDSFDSSQSAYSNNGRYPAGDTSKLRDNGDIASNDSIVNAVTIGNANIYGRVSVGANGTMAVGTGGGVGTRSWQSSNPGQVQPGYFSDDMNFTFPTVTLPYTTGLTPQPLLIYSTNYTLASATNTVTSSTYPSPTPATGVQTNISYSNTSTIPSPVPYGIVTNTLTQYREDNSFPHAGTYIGTPVKIVNTSKWSYYEIKGTNYTYPSFTFTYSTVAVTTNFTVTSTGYDYVLQGNPATMAPLDYYLPELPGGNILVRGNARLVVAGNLDVAGNKPENQITLASDGKLEMWVGGTSAKLSGNGVINPTGFAQNFILWCTDSVTDLSLNGNGQFTGIITAPNANVRLNGGGNGPDDFIGALIANTVTLNGHFNFHYDEALKNYRHTGRYMVKEWNEIPVATLSN